MSSERASHADVVGALAGGCLGLVVDLFEVGRGDAMCGLPFRRVTFWVSYEF